MFIFLSCVYYLQFHRTFYLTAQSTDKGSFESNLAFAVQNRVGTAEEVPSIMVAQ
jgi:xeroderma pigmentosum group C-complementing protein